MEGFEAGAILLISGFLFGSLIAASLLCCLQIIRSETRQEEQAKKEKKD